MSMHASETQPNEELLTTISALHRATRRFVSVLEHSGCPVLHITGRKYLFSCYELGSAHLVALCSEMADSTHPSACTDYEAYDQLMIDVLADLKRNLGF